MPRAQNQIQIVDTHETSETLAVTRLQRVGYQINRTLLSMDILYLLIPLSVALVFFILAGLWWAIDRGQFEDIEAEGERILRDD